MLTDRDLWGSGAWQEASLSLFGCPTLESMWVVGLLGRRWKGINRDIEVVIHPLPLWSLQKQEELGRVLSLQPVTHHCCHL